MVPYMEYRSHSDQIKIIQSLRQGCILSPILFNVYSEYIFREAHKLNNMLIMMLFAVSIEGLQKLMVRLNRIKNSFEIDITKTKQYRSQPLHQ